MIRIEDMSVRFGIQVRQDSHAGACPYRRPATGVHFAGTCAGLRA
jgi:hypothetical protein